MRMQKIRDMRSALWLVVVSSLVAAAMTAVACGGTETVVQTVVVEKEVPVEIQVTVETVKEVVVQGETVVQTVEVERVVEKEVQVEVTATAAPRGPIEREDTFVITGFGPGATEWRDPDNMNPYSLGGLGRVRGILNKTIYEFLYLYNHNEGEVIPWLAESSEVDDDFMGVNVTLREGIEWSDGMPFTTEDVKFTIELLMANPDMVFAGDIQEWVKDVEIIDDRNFRINYNKPNARFFYFYFQENSEIHLPILPKHIWEGQDPLEFPNFDLDKGWPVGTGPFVATRADSQGQIFDRNDNWWAAKVGFKELPEPLRIAYIPPGSADTMVARMINNEFDTGSIMQPGVFVTAHNRNKNIISWDTDGPSYGAADACMYTLGVNTQYGPMSDVNARRAVQAAVDRDQLVALAYENSTVTRSVPYSTYGGLKAYEDAQADIIAKYDWESQGQAEVESHMAAAGYTMGSGGYWEKDGEELAMDLHVPGWLKPMGPVVEKQMQDAGFDVTFVLHDPDTAPLWAEVRTGLADMWILVHCGSSREPHGTMQHYHSKFSSPTQGEQNSYIWANSQYNNPEFDAIIDEMDSVLPSTDDPQYMDLANRALDIFLDDVIEITLAEERHVVTFNNTYWRGFATNSNPYVAPYSLWAGFLLEILNVSKAQ
ncbi:MAG: ABC transporter substrate-binding protein [Chloroflexi bacterium]|nr:ABC transporter substrate-binding protein [Chloroflexota bacterium]